MDISVCRIFICNINIYLYIQDIENGFFFFSHWSHWLRLRNIDYVNLLEKGVQRQSVSVEEILMLKR